MPTKHTWGPTSEFEVEIEESDTIVRAFPESRGRKVKEYRRICTNCEAESVAYGSPLQWSTRFASCEQHLETHPKPV